MQYIAPDSRHIMPFQECHVPSFQPVEMVVKFLSTKLISGKKSGFGGKMCNFAANYNNQTLTINNNEDEKDYDWSGRRHLYADDQLW